MQKIFRQVKNTKGKENSVILTLNDDGEVDLSHSLCTCIFGSWYRFAGKWKKKKTLCWHMLKVFAEVGLKLPPEYQTERNLKLIDEIKQHENRI